MVSGRRSREVGVSVTGSSVICRISIKISPAGRSRVECRMARLGRLAHCGGEPQLEPSMLPDPLHPAVVHFPIVLMFLLPVAAVAALWRIRNGARVSRAWTLVLAAAAALAASAWLAVETGESDEEAVERVVAEAPIGRHEEAAERFLLLAGGMVVLAGLGL